jgi:hypothetical protein
MNVLSQNADMAAGPILITEDRRKVVDFTTPFMLLQATLLLRRPAAGQEPKVKDLADLVGQSEIKYGTLRRGVIPRSFRHTNDSLLTIVWRNMRRSVYGVGAVGVRSEWGSTAVQNMDGISKVQLYLLRNLKILRAFDGETTTIFFTTLANIRSFIENNFEVNIAEHTRLQN